MWTQFMDMHSGGGQKLKWSYIYIEAPEDEAKVIFYNRFGRNPERVTCTCCGSDYSISESINLKQVTGYERGCPSLKTPEYKTGKKKGLYKKVKDKYFEENYYLEKGEIPKGDYEIDERFSTYRKYQTLEEYIKRKDILVIYSNEIEDTERHGDVPQEGYIWA